MFISCRDIFQKHLIKIAFVLSILLHLLGFLSYRLLGLVPLVPIKISELLKRDDQTERRMVFELVETPESARSEQPPNEAQLLSDKNTVARDQYTGKDKPKGAPYSEGDLDIHQWPEPAKDVASASSQPELEPAQRTDSDDQRFASIGTRYEPLKFSRQELLKKSPSIGDVQPIERSPARPLYDNRKFSVDDLGGFSFNTYAWDFAPYMLEMKRKVERNVFPPPAFTRMGLISGETVLRFKVMPNGEVKDLVVLKYTGHESLKETSVNAIKNSAPFRPLPADFPENYLEVTAAFTYYVKR
ncbi:MAG: energy transducer TonB [candidate division KSB1 bacterium]|nr:energy transducer TonB [candidate division KSB1 bacterium]MDZ7334595.1 energy transducer TonB [candidate division KSB1 bacterium]MDZ7356598.1 energy transducer TonB [candidate division KSB1 bacterium]MDZ7375726.1 energy transducer TonB [candidate division KSB1 bacterium]MDZ7399915.1 energy transducer TonB [candidate division KSB1 bacterium]